VPVAAPSLQAERPPLPGARYQLSVLLAINMLNFIDRQVLAAVEPLIAKEFFPPDPVTGKAPDGAQLKMGLLATAFLVSYMVFSPLFGWLADRTSRWAIIGVGVLMFTLASGASGLATGFWLMLITRVFVGIGEAAYAPAAPTIISDLYPVSRRGSVLSWFYVAIPVGSALGYVLGGWLGATFGWHWAFIAVVPPGILLGIWAFFMKDPPRGQVDNVEHKPARLSWATYRLILTTPSYVYNVIGMTAMTFAIGGVSFWMPRYIAVYRAKDFGPGMTPEALLGQVNFLFGVIVVVSGLLATLSGGWLADRLRPRYGGSYFLVSGLAMLVGFPLFLAVLYVPFPTAWVFVFLGVFFLFFNTGPTNTIIANVTHPLIRSSAYALCIFVIHAFGDAISPPLIGLINDRSGSMNTGFFVVSFAILIGAIAWLMGVPHLKRDTELAPRRLPE
jgi:MFS family permease